MSDNGKGPEWLKNPTVRIMGAIVLALVFARACAPADEKKILQASGDTPYSEFVAQTKDNRMHKIQIEKKLDGSATVIGLSREGQLYRSQVPSGENPYERLRDYGAEVTGVTEKSDPLISIIVSLLPILLLVGVMVWLARSQMAKSGGMGGFGKTKAQMISPDDIEEGFDDVAGIDEVKEDLEDLVKFLKDPHKFQRLGGRMPRGVLMEGPPGVGKTMMAKAIAKEAKVPFFSMSGSDFVEMFVGVGAARVRDTFAEAKKQAPCIIFVDEIDAVGGARGRGGPGGGGGNDEREQTLNAMLAEMDGFNTQQGIIVLAATNRIDMLDPALVRPGRFDRQVKVPLPDVKGREKILRVHAKKITMDPNIELRDIARGTPGFAGADLKNLLNESALFAAKRDAKFVQKSDIEKAKDKITMGAERKGLSMAHHVLKNTAYHEIGHVLVAKMLGKSVHKVSIVPRNKSLGVTLMLPEDDRVSYSKQEIENEIAILFGGRVAEEIIFKDVTTGASNDIERATAWADGMVNKWGMSPLGLRKFAPNDQQSAYQTYNNQVSPETARQIDVEIKDILDRQEKVAKDLLTNNYDVFVRLSETLLELEDLDSDEIDLLIAGDNADKVRQARKAEEDAGRRSGANDNGAVAQLNRRTGSDNTPS